MYIHIVYHHYKVHKNVLTFVIFISFWWKMDDYEHDIGKYYTLFSCIYQIYRLAMLWQYISHSMSLIPHILYNMINTGDRTSRWRYISHSAYAVPNSSNYGPFFHKLWVFVVISDAYTVAFGAMPDLSNCGNIFLNFYVFVQYLRKEWVDFVHI